MHSNFKSDINSYIYLTWNNYSDNVLIFASNSFQILPNFKYVNDNSPYDKANTKDEIILEVVENESQISFMCILLKSILHLNLLDSLIKGMCPYVPEATVFLPIKS